jgi:hypothetical protein
MINKSVLPTWMTKEEEKESNHRNQEYKLVQLNRVISGRRKKNAGTIPNTRPPSTIHQFRHFLDPTGGRLVFSSPVSSILHSVEQISFGPVCPASSIWSLGCS